MPASQLIVGNYRMFHLIRAGAIYEIWAVRPVSENTPYAMKWLPPGAKYSRSTVAELKHEFQVGSTLDHPSVIQTLEFGNTPNGAFMLLELFKVPNLKQQIISGGYKKLQHRAKAILSAAAAGVAHLNERGWIHRDIKPDNFMVRDDDVVKLIDFNLARKRASGLSKLFGGKTKVQGTHSYMSPEQIRGQTIDVRADVYSFGCMMHEFFSGKPPFSANTPNELLQRHLSNKPQPLTVFDKNITPDFAAYVMRMMAKDPNDRPNNMKDVMMEIKTQRLFYNPPQPPAAPDESNSTAKND
ncbi:MAG TPA: serine/threonine-protein kinase [Lacipirellulaceae bacterium]|nr:serine/threonine-protein kinase [Lacipirellulaceae bacterium]